jgi:hypothetical protein
MIFLKGVASQNAEDNRNCRATFELLKENEAVRASVGFNQVLLVP